MLPHYQSLLSTTPENISEVNQSYHFLTERHLQAMWMEQKYFLPLVTLSQERVEVLSPGIWNSEAGPDFKKAHIKIGQREYKGDIEIHLTDEGWQQHKHHSDERYNNVILHISLWKPKNTRTISTNNGRVILQAYFEEHLTIPAARIINLIDLDLYPYRKFIGSGKCAHTVFRHLPPQRTLFFFKAAASWRLQQKDKLLRERIADPSLLMGAGMALALGYKNNSDAFFDLFLNLYEYRNHTVESLFTKSLAPCGFFNPHHQLKWGCSEYYQHLLAASTQSAYTTRYSLTLNQIRPLNHPLRRLFVLVQLVKDPLLPLYFSRLEDAWRTHWKTCQNKKSWAKLRHRLCALLPNYEDPYWNFHYTFETVKQSSSLCLVGDELKQQMLINTFLPLLHRHVLTNGHAAELAALFEFYDAMPASHRGKTRYLIHRFFGDSPKGSLLKTAAIEQGAYQLHHDFCIHYEASCEGCPFAEKLAALGY